MSVMDYNHRAAEHTGQLRAELQKQGKPIGPYNQMIAGHARSLGDAQMPWKECKPMDERLKFVARLLDGEKMSPLCREFGISRPTGYKIFNRYKDCGLDGLQDRSRRPYRCQSTALPD